MGFHYTREYFPTIWEIHNKNGKRVTDDPDFRLRIEKDG